MFDTWLRAFKDRLLAPVLGRLRYRVNPVTVTVAACLSGVGAALVASERRYTLALVLWLANRALDGIDGSLARLQGTQSELGGYLDILLDFVVYALIPIGLVAGRPTPDAWAAALALMATFYVNAASWMYLAAILARRGLGSAPDQAVAMPAGLIGGGETIVFYILFLVFPAQLVPLFATLAALVVVTVVQRLVGAATMLRRVS